MTHRRGFIYALGLALSLPAMADQPSLCETGEGEVFSCVTTSKKSVSVCASAGITRSSKQGYVVYRFGQKDKIELQLLSRDPANQESPLYYHYFRPQTDRVELWFDGGDATYTVFSDYDGVRPSEAAAGVMVGFRGGSRSVTISCKKGYRANWALIEGVVNCSDEEMNSCTSP